MNGQKTSVNPPLRTGIALPYLLVLACPLMHLFMHGGHGRQGGQGRQAGQGSDTRHDCCAPAQDEPARPQPLKQGERP